MASGSFWVIIAQGNHLCNVCPWQTDNFYEKINLCNIVSTMLGQTCRGILSSQCCPNTSETKLHKKITCAMLAQSTQTRFRRKITYTMLSWSACANIAHRKYLCNVDPKPKNNFLQQNNIQYCLDLCGPTIAQGIYLFNVIPWLPNNFSYQSKLCNVVSTKMGKHCIEKSYTQCLGQDYTK